MMFKFILFAIVAAYFSVASAGNFTLKCHDMSWDFTTFKTATDSMRTQCSSDRTVELSIPEGNLTEDKVEIRAESNQWVWIKGQGSDKSILWKSNIELHGSGNITLHNFGMTGCDCDTSQSICYNEDACVQHAYSDTRSPHFTKLTSMKFWNVNKTAVMVKRNTLIRNSTFWKISGSEAAAVKVYSANYLGVEQSIFKDLTNDIGGAGIMVEENNFGASMVSVDDSHFENCMAEEDGGAIKSLTRNSMNQLMNNVFTKCISKSGNGGAVSTLTVMPNKYKDNTFTACKAFLGMGGGIFSTGPLDVNDCVFKDCEALKDGGAIYQKLDYNITIESSKFTNCMVNTKVNDTIPQLGAAVSFEAQNSTLKKNKFDKNRLLNKNNRNPSCEKSGHVCCWAALDRSKMKCVGKLTPNDTVAKKTGFTILQIVGILLLVIGAIAGAWWFWQKKKLQAQRDVLLDNEYQNMDDMDGMDTL